MAEMMTATEHVKSIVDSGNLPTTREFERMLTQDYGFTRSQAIDLINGGYPALVAKRAGDGDDDREAIERLRAAYAKAREHLRAGVL